MTRLISLTPEKIVVYNEPVWCRHKKIGNEKFLSSPFFNLKKFLYFPTFFYHHNPKFNLIFILIFAHFLPFWPTFHSYISPFFTIFSHQKIAPLTLIRSQIPTQFLFLYSPHFLSHPLTKNNLSHRNSIYLKRTQLKTLKQLKKMPIYTTTKFHCNLFNHLSYLKDDIL